MEGRAALRVHVEQVSIKAEGVTQLVQVVALDRTANDNG